MVASKLITADELLALGEDARIELIEGELHAMSPTGPQHMLVVSELVRSLILFFATRPGFRVCVGEGGYVLGRNPDTVLAPDIAILSDVQIQSVKTSNNSFIPVSPLLVVEVKSPSDREADIARKLANYLEAGVREVWWVRPQEGQMSVHRPDRAPEVVAADQTFTGSDVLPGFSYSMPELFRPSPASH
jgi:Uma2 family endonuclease